MVAGGGQDEGAPIGRLLAQPGPHKKNLAEARFWCARRFAAAQCSAWTDKNHTHSSTATTKPSPTAIILGPIRPDPAPRPSVTPPRPAAPVAAAGDTRPASDSLDRPHHFAHRGALSGAQVEGRAGAPDQQVYQGQHMGAGQIADVFPAFRLGQSGGSGGPPSSRLTPRAWHEWGGLLGWFLHRHQTFGNEIGGKIGIVQRGTAHLGPEFDLALQGAQFGLSSGARFIHQGFVDANGNGAHRMFLAWWCDVATRVVETGLVSNHVLNDALKRRHGTLTGTG